MTGHVSAESVLLTRLTVGVFTSRRYLSACMHPCVSFLAFVTMPAQEDKKQND